MLPFNVKYFFKKNKAIAESHIKNLLEMAQADGETCEEELAFLKKVSLKNKIHENQLDWLQKNIHAIPFYLPPNKPKRFYQLYELVQMMTLDNFVDREELKLCKAFAAKLGYPKEIISELIETVTFNIEYGLDYNESMKRVAFLLQSKGIV